MADDMQSPSPLDPRSSDIVDWPASMGVQQLLPIQDYNYLQKSV